MSVLMFAFQEMALCGVALVSPNPPDDQCMVLAADGEHALNLNTGNGLGHGGFWMVHYGYRASCSDDGVPVFMKLLKGDGEAVGRPPLVGLRVIHGDDSVPDGYIKIYRNIRLGCGGTRAYLCVQYRAKGDASQPAPVHSIQAVPRATLQCSTHTPLAPLLYSLQVIHCVCVGPHLTPIDYEFPSGDVLVFSRCGVRPCICLASSWRCHDYHCVCTESYVPTDTWDWQPKASGTSDCDAFDEASRTWQPARCARVKESALIAIIYNHGSQYHTDILDIDTALHRLAPVPWAVVVLLVEPFDGVAM